MGKSTINRNIKTANLAKELFQKRDFAQFVSLFTRDGTLVFQADSAKIGEVPIVPFAGTFEGHEGIQEFIKRLGDSTVGGANLGPIKNILFNCDGDVELAFTITAQPRCGDKTGPISTNDYVARFHFNKCGQIDLLEIFGDVSSITLFFAVACLPR